MKQSPTRRVLVSIGEIMIIIASSLSLPLVPTNAAHATVASPGSLSSTIPPNGILVDSPWVVDSSGTEWAYATTTSSMGTLISRNRTTREFTSREISAGDQGSISGLYSPVTNLAVFSARRAGAGNRIMTFDLTTGTRLATRTLATDENLIRALTFTATGDSYTIGTNQNPAKVMKFTTTTGALEYSSTLGTGLKEITAFIPNGPEMLVAVNTTPVKLVAVTRNKLVVGTVYSLAAGTPALMDPVVIGNTAYLGTDATPGRITAIDIPTKTVVGSAMLNSGEVGARNLVIDESTGTLYATTDSTSGPRIASFRLSDLSRLGTTQLSAGASVNSLLFYGRTLAAGFAGARGVEEFTVAPEPNAPVVTGVQGSDSSLTVSWNTGGSIEPILNYTSSATAGSSTSSCTSTGLSCTIRGLRNGTTYTISVTARSVAGVSAAATSSGTPRSVPESPTISEVVRGNSVITVSWAARSDGGSPITRYRATASPSGRMCESITPTCTITGLVNGVSQTVTVVATNSLGNSLASAPSAAVRPATTPNAPRIESVNRISQGAAITWEMPTSDGGEDIVSYLVRVTQDSRMISESTANATSTTLGNLTNGLPYDVVVIAANAVGTGTPSESVRFTPATFPDPPSATTAQRRDSGADVSWTPPTDNGGDPITGYRVTVREGGGDAMSFVATASPFTIRGLNNGTTYSVSVSAVNAVGLSNESTSTEVTPATVPGTPTAIRAQRRDSGAEISWTPPTNDGGDTITGYRVTVREGAENTTSFVTTESPFSIRGLKNGTIYSVVVTAINSVGEGAESESAEVTPATVPGTPTAIRAQRRDSGAEVSWTPPTNNGGGPITGYRVTVRRGTDNAISVDAAESPLSIAGLINGTIYSVVVTAINSVGEGAESESAEVTPATIPDPPIVLNATGSDGGMSVEWSSGANNGGDALTGYRVRIWLEATLISEFETTETLVTVSGLANGVEHRVTVSSLNTVGESVWSVPSFVIPMSPPVVEPPGIEPPVIEPPITDPPIIDPPPTVRLPGAPVNVKVLATSRKRVTVGWAIRDSGGAPVIDYIVHASRYKNRGFTVWPDATSATPWIELRKPRRGDLYIRVIAVTRGGESAPSQAKRVVRAAN